MAVALLAVALVPALDALHPGLVAVAVHSNLAREHYHLTGKMETVLAEPFDALEDAATAAGSPAVATTYSDAPAAPERRLVFLSRYDGDDADADADPFTGTDADLIWVRVQLEGTSQVFETLRHR